MSTNRMVAGYARVSSDQQAKGGTIDSQIAALEERIKAEGEHVAEGKWFIDAGVSGATLIRPQLERLRDCAAAGLVDRLYVLSPDRLSRKYAHQVLILEEMLACGVEVIFLNHAIGDSPEEALLLQMQGMISEYERAKIMERNRRGKLHAAKRGSVNVLSGAPYGYRYQRKQLDGTPARYVIDLPQAAVVRKIFHWVAVERMSLGEVTRRLDEGSVTTASGKPHWDRSVVWGMLQNPAYMGQAAFGKTRMQNPLPRIRNPRHGAEIPKRCYSSVRTERAKWITVPVPAIVSEAQFLATQEQLDENRKRARQSRRGAAYLLQGLIVCGICQYAYYGKKISRAASKGGVRTYAYYRCVGTDAYRFGGERICGNHQVRTDTLDDLVWRQVVELLENPGRLKSEYDRRLNVIEKDQRTQSDWPVLQKQRLHLEKSKSRLIDSYADGTIDKEDFEPRVRALKIRLEQMDLQIVASRSLQSNQQELLLVINRLEEFSAECKTQLANPDFIMKRDIIRALVKRVEIHKEDIIIVFRVDPDPRNSTEEDTASAASETKSLLDCSRRCESGVGQFVFTLHV